MVSIHDPWAAYQFDNAVVWAGITIENAAQEMIKVGGEKEGRMELRYTMKQLLDPAFRLPNDTKESTDPAMLKGIDGLAFDEVG